MKAIDKDRQILKNLVESYGKADVLKYVKHINEEINDGADTETYLLEVGFYDSGGYKIYKKSYLLAKTVEYPIDNHFLTDEAIDSICQLNDIELTGYSEERHFRADANCGFLVWKVIETGAEAEKDYDIYVQTLESAKYLESKKIVLSL